MSNKAPSPLDLVRRHNLNLKKSLGQNLLIDPTHLARIAGAADLEATDTVLEIGPGLGALTHHLAERAGRVIAVELDQRLMPVLRAEFADRPHVSFVHGDILELNPAEIIHMLRPDQPGTTAAAEPYKVVGNLPYYITSAVLRHVLESLPPPTLAVLLVQQEVAQRMVAQCGAMSLLAVSVQFYARPRALHKIPAGAFLPRPKVDSRVVRLDVRAQPAVSDVEPARFFQVVRAGFSQRRKQLRNSLSAGLSCTKEQADRWLTSSGIEPRRRAETLSLQEWGMLTRTVYGTA
ncbi:MAG: ribosomal RNA small subunit methyltransferase A [Caldilineaceae bacterium SB0661_bin_32]|uniref:Ribosomal RNA small subunit methyltransferase A n=1 Tax=Caldilineaceae bacterium SB0661_bin_32 TaxID=2605255 RepID=A0A6B1D615_9CHLR|nr:ribosomal RNA small subunit methyltransferase A [Caldilineaceae bacterium SB0661_bin_32]